MSYNPFLSDMPVVFVVRGVRQTTNALVKTPIKKSKRLFARIPNYKITPQEIEFNKILFGNLVYYNNLKKY